MSSLHFAGLFGPARMPREIVERLSRETNAILKRADVRDQLVRQGYAVQGSTPEELAAKVGDNLTLFKRLARESKIALE